MGGILSFLWRWWTGPHVGAITDINMDLGPDADEPEAATGLTKRHKHIMRTTWEMVKPDFKNNAINFFVEFFRVNPHLIARFKGFADVPLDKLRENKRVAAHACTVFTAITNLVDNLNDTSVLVELLKNTGRNHKRRNIPKTDFDLLPPVLIKFLGTILASVWTPSCEVAWTLGFKVINAVIINGYEQEETFD